MFWIILLLPLTLYEATRLLGLEKEDRAVSEVEVDEMFGFCVRQFVYSVIGK